MARESTLQAMQRIPRPSSPNPTTRTLHEDTNIPSDDDSDFVPHWVFEMVKKFFFKPPLPIPPGINQLMFIPQLTAENLRSLKATLKQLGPQAAYVELEEKMMDWIDPFRMRPTMRKSKGSFTNVALSELKTISTIDDSSTAIPPAADIPLAVVDFSRSANAAPDVSHLLCKYHILGACPEGESCPFSHELVQTKRTVCKYFLKGRCKLGEACANTHVLPTDLVVNRIPRDSVNNLTTIAPKPPEHDIPVTHSAVDFLYRGNPTRTHESLSQSFASYHSAQSSLVGNASLASKHSTGFRYPAFGFTRRNTSSFQQSPKYYSAESSRGIVTEKDSKEDPTEAMSEYLKAVKDRGLILPLDQELNWSGRENGGQHVEFAKGAALPFEVIGPIGASLTAQIDKIRCRRILLARKTMVCGRRMTVEEALIEVEHLQKLRHPHIVQLVGSYLQGKKFSVLLYPVADCDFVDFLEQVLDIVQETPDMKYRAANGNRTVTAGTLFVKSAPQAIASMWHFFGCLVDAVKYIHSTARKHLDIKPGNILVRKHAQAAYGYRIYIADFGISRSFKSLDHSQTDTHIRRTPKYCAPEVWEQDVHGRAADIFSLGCVFMEMLTVLCGRDLDEFVDFRSQSGQGSGAYHESIDQVFEWAEQLRPELEDCFMYETLFQTFESNVSMVPKINGLHATLQMLARNPEERRMPIFQKGELVMESCSACGDIPEKFEYFEELGV